jgi:AraC-like DNA-binding protein
MSSALTELSSFTAEWVSGLRNVQQAAVGDFFYADPIGLRRAVRRLKHELPAATSFAERLFLRQAIMLFLDRSSRYLHDRFHDCFDRRACGVAPPLTREADWLSASSMDELLDAWMERYIEWLESAHKLPVVWRATECLRQRPSECWTVDRLARHVGCSRSTLLKQFVAFGITPAEYLARIRVRNGLCGLRRTTRTVEEAALAAGYRSSSKFYGRVFRYTGMTPGAIKMLEPRVFERMLDQCVPLRPASHSAASIAITR